MRLYPKKLRNINDLEKERALLIKKSRELEKEDILSVDGLLGKKKNKGNEGAEGSFMDFLPVSNPIVGLLVKMVQRSSDSYRRQKDTPLKVVNAPPPCPEEKPGKSKIKAIAKEFIGGYLKWKAIELSFKGIRYLISSMKEKKEPQ